MRVAGPVVRHQELLDLPGFRVEPPDVARPVSRVPHGSVAVHDEVVRTGAVVQVELLEVTGFRIQVGGVVGLLTHEPDLAVGADERVARAALFPGHLPLVDLDLLLVLGNRRGGRSKDRGQGRDNDGRDALHGASLELLAVFDC